MTGAFEKSWVESRRLLILRLLAELGGEANESVIASAVRQGGFEQSSKDSIRADIDYLREVGCATETWLDTLRVVSLTERGEDCAHGRVEILGIEHSIWRRH